MYSLRVRTFTSDLHGKGDLALINGRYDLRSTRDLVAHSDIMLVLDDEVRE